MHLFSTVEVVVKLFPWLPNIVNRAAANVVCFAFGRFAKSAHFEKGPFGPNRKDFQFSFGCYVVLQQSYPEKLSAAEDECLIICLPDFNSIRNDLDSLDSDFFDLHILREKPDEGWFGCFNPKLPLIIEIQNENQIKLVSGPDYQPSFSRGLYASLITDIVFGVNANFCQYKMFLLDRPIVPKYAKADLSNVRLSASSSGISSLNSSKCASAISTTTTVLSTNGRANAVTSSRQSSASSCMGRPYATNHNQSVSASRASLRSKSEGRHTNRKSQSAPNSKKAPKAPRQWSADSGVGTECVNPGLEGYQCDAPYLLPARITAYAE